MHAWLAFLAGILIVVGGILIFGASLGIAYYGLAVEFEIAIAIVLLVIAGIAACLFYFGYKRNTSELRLVKKP